ncbi:MAG: SDR family NAD(P)-dependent oxidoreductase, partial [Sphingobacteriales bacterium]
VYAATKAFVLSFSEAIQNEIEDSAVTMTVLCPPATDTNFFKVADAENTNAANGELATPEEVAEAGYKALMNGDARVVPTWAAKMQAASSNIMPDSVLAANMRKQMEPKEN